MLNGAILKRVTAPQRRTLRRSASAPANVLMAANQCSGYIVGLGPVSVSPMPVSPFPGTVVRVSQVLSRKLYLPALKAGDASPPKIVAVDLQPMAPIEGVVQLQGDITSEETAAQVRGRGKWGWGEAH